MTTNEVLEGEDGWLFLAGGSNDPAAYLKREKVFDADTASRWCELLASRVQRVGRARYMHLFAPNKETIYFREAGLTEGEVSRSPLSTFNRLMTPQQRESLRDIVIDPTNYFRRIASQHQLYWKTDSHWSPTGCFAAYQLVCATLGIDHVRDLLSRPFGEGNVAMDLGGKLSPPRKELVRFYRFTTNAERVHANAIVELKEARALENEVGLHVGSNVVFRNEAASDPRRVILFGDSFSEYRPSLLTGMLAETFQEVHFVWSVYMDTDYIKHHNPDIVLTEIVERFMPTTPNDSFDLARYARRKVMEYTEE